MKQSKNVVAIITMMFLFGMIAFVTNLAAPIGVIWKNAFSDSQNANTIGMLGNAMNFLAYLFMGIPSGRMLGRLGYKRTALCGIATGFAGILLQLLSGAADGVPGFAVYLAGAFVCGFSVCMLNTVVNPMTNLLGGGGNKGNQLNLIGGTVNSLAGTLTPMLVGAMIGTVTSSTRIVDVDIVLYVAMAVFLVSFCILSFLPIQNPEEADGEDAADESRSPWSFRNFKFGAVAIFLYVGVEVGIPGTLFFYISDTTAAGGGFGLDKAATVAGFVSATYWFLMLVGRFVAGFIAGKVSSRNMLAATSSAACLLIVAAVALGNGVSVSMPVFTGSGFSTYSLPAAALLLVLCGLCTSVMWSCIFNLAVEGLGRCTALGSGIFMMMVVGGGLMPLLQNFVADHVSYMSSYAIPLCCIVYILYYALSGSRTER